MMNRRHPPIAENGARKTVKSTKRRRKSLPEADVITTSLTVGGIAPGDAIGDILDHAVGAEVEAEAGVEAEATTVIVGIIPEAMILLVTTVIIDAVIGTMIDMMTLTETDIVTTRDIDGIMMTIETIGQRGVVREEVITRLHATSGGKRISTRTLAVWGGPTQKRNTMTDPKRSKVMDSRVVLLQAPPLEILVPIENSSERRGRNNKTCETKTCKSAGRENE